MNEGRCGAKNRQGKPCRRWPSQGKTRCRLHGGAAGSGAPKGNRNAWKHGNRSAEAETARKVFRDFLKACRIALE